MGKKWDWQALLAARKNDREAFLAVVCMRVPGHLLFPLSDAAAGLGLCKAGGAWRHSV